MTQRATEAGSSRLGTLIWAFYFAVVSAVHGAVAMVLLNSSSSSDSDFVAGAAVVMLDLPETPAAMPTPQTDLPPGPEEAASEQTPPPKEETKPPEKEAEVALPEPEPPKPEPPMEERQATAPPSIAAVPDEAPPTAGVETPEPRTPSANVLRWQSRLSAQIARLKHYPAKAQARHEEGTVRITFTIDRNGRVLESHVVESSGSEELDREFLSMLVRAQPLPKPPGDAQDVDMSFVMAMRFNLK